MEDLFSSTDEFVEIVTGVNGDEICAEATPANPRLSVAISNRVLVKPFKRRLRLTIVRDDIVFKVSIERRRSVSQVR